MQKLSFVVETLPQHNQQIKRLATSLTAVEDADMKITIKQEIEAPTGELTLIIEGTEATYSMFESMTKSVEPILKSFAKLS